MERISLVLLMVGLIGRAEAQVATKDTVAVELRAVGGEFKVLGATRRNAAYVAPRDLENGKGPRVDMLDPGGQLLASIAYDFRAAGVGRDGDAFYPADYALMLKLPDLAGFYAMRLWTDAGHSFYVPVGPIYKASADSGVIVQTVMSTGPSANRIDLVILGDGYRLAEIDKFRADVASLTSFIFGPYAEGPYHDYAKWFNIHTVFRPSNESGVDHPEAKPPVYRDTAYDSTYNVNGTARLTRVVDDQLAMQDVAQAPDFDLVFVLLNDSTSGGSGGRIATGYNGGNIGGVGMHELSHSFAHLGDEYNGSGNYTGPEPEADNLTIDPACPRWSEWSDTPYIGCLAGGGQYNTGVYHPGNYCLMLAGGPLCVVCWQSIVRHIHALVNPIENATPTSRYLSAVEGTSLSFAFSNSLPVAGTVTWYVDGVARRVGGTSFSWVVPTAPSAGMLSLHSVVAVVTDTTARVRSDPRGALSHRVEWRVESRALP